MAAMTRVQTERRCAILLPVALSAGYFLGFEDVRDWANLLAGAVMAGWLTATVLHRRELLK